MQLEFYAICQMRVIAISRCNLLNYRIMRSKRGFDVHVPADETVITNNNNGRLIKVGEPQQCGRVCVLI